MFTAGWVRVKVLRVQNTLCVGSVRADPRPGEDVPTDGLWREGIRPGGLTGQSSALQVGQRGRETLLRAERSPD